MHDIGVQAPVGVEPGGNYIVTAYNRSGSTMAVGDVVQFDLQLSSTEAVTLAKGGATSGWGNVVAPTAAGVELGLIFGVVQESIADNAKGKVMIRGVTDAFVIASTGSVAVGSPLVVTTAKNFDLVAAAGEGYWALGLEAVTTPVSRELASVYVDGLRGFGSLA